MKTKISLRLLALAFLATISSPLTTIHAQGASFTYQGRLNSGGSPASGSYDLKFTLYAMNLTGSIIAGPVTNSAVPVTNGLFLATIDFGGVFDGNPRWLDIAVRTNGAATFTTLAPRQPLTPAPYAIFANTASNLSGTLPSSHLTGTVGNAQLANSGVTITAGTGLTGGGAVALGGSTTLNNAGVLSVTGNADITASMVAGAVTLGDTGVAANTPNTLVKRDGFGNFYAGSIQLAANFYLPTTTANAGIIYMGGAAMIHSYGSQNFFAGYGAGNFTMTGSDNIGMGSLTLAANATGNDNSAVGYAALVSNKTGSDNTANGYEALYSNTTGYQNTANGSSALYYNAGGYNNTADGYAALTFNTNGFQNTASGYYALNQNTSGNNNTASGADALLENTTGNNNTASGASALLNNMTGGGNTATGASALKNNLTGSDNTAIGTYALLANTIGANNTAVGINALYSNTNGGFNAAGGNAALYSNTSGSENTAFGDSALYSNTSGGNNTASGENALGANTTGSDNVALGTDALFFNLTGNNNTAVGVESLIQSSGSGNVALGYFAGYNVGSGNDNIHIANSGFSGDDSTIRIGAQSTQTKTFIAGIYGATAASGVPVYVNSSGQLGTLTSSARFKTDIQSMGDASDTLLALHPVTYKYKPEIDPQGLPQFGLVAEEVEKVNPALVAHDQDGKIYTVRYEAVNAMLLNEFLKQHQTVAEQKAEIDKLKNEAAKVTSLESRLAGLEKLVRALNPQE